MKAHSFKSSIPLVIGTIGVVFGDIGTSPLYTLKECFKSGHLPLEPNSILGVLSLIFWLLLIIVSLKYLLLVLRADHQGEGGILALTTLVLRSIQNSYKPFVLCIGMIGMALFYGDGIITPAISILSALEGLTINTPYLNHYILPLSAGILILLFLFQRWGTESISHWFSPIMIIWFSVIGILGGVQIIKNPLILKAINPLYAIKFFTNHGYLSLLSLGAIVLAVTGAEALYADIGHFNKKSIRISWFSFVWPCLILNYYGQGALLLSDPATAVNPFYCLVPTWGIYPMVLLSTMATIIASQSVISGVFSISCQAIQLGYLPRMKAVHTSRKQFGQVYLPVVNYLMLTLTLIAVLFFQSSDALAAAYGLSVVGIMFITTILILLLTYSLWNWSFLKIGWIFGSMVFIDTVLLGANSFKIMEGGWLPLIIAFVIYQIINTWKKIRQTLVPEHHPYKTIVDFIHLVRETPPLRVPGVAVFMGNNPERIPTAFNIYHKHTPALHETVFFLSVVTKNTPKISSCERLKIIHLGGNVYQVLAFYGFNETPNLKHVMEKIFEEKPIFNLNDTTFFLIKDLPVKTQAPYFKGWKEYLFIFLARNSMSPAEYFKIPYSRVVELGVHFKISKT